MVVLHVLEVFLMTVMTVLLIRGENSQNNLSIRSDQWCGPPAVDLVTHCWIFVVFCRNMLMELMLKSNLMTKMCKINSTC